MKPLVLVVVLLTAAAAAAQGYDAPLRKQVIDYGLPPDLRAANPQVAVPHDKLTCFYYRAGLIVKQFSNQWNKGAIFLSFQRFDQAQPACVKEHAPTEKVLDPNEWSGYFRGVKGDIVFFDADDGTDGGMPFAVYDSKTGKKIFEDNAYWAGMWNPKLRPRPSPFNDMRVRLTPSGNIVLTYLRVLGTECDIPNKAAECWLPLVQKLGLKSAVIPRCTRWEKNETPSASAVAYPVETSLLPTATTKTIPGPVMCWPVD